MATVTESRCQLCGDSIVGKRVDAKWCSARCKMDAAYVQFKARRAVDLTVAAYGSPEHRAKISNARRRHGLSRSSTWLSWSNMRKRCLDPDNPNWPHYGGRGIRICDRWAASFDNFLADMGEKPSDPPGWHGKQACYSIDRIDNDGNYEPGNCRWATRKQQNANQRPNRGRHVRWHVNRDVVSEDCPWCREGEHVGHCR